MATEGGEDMMVEESTDSQQTNNSKDDSLSDLGQLISKTEVRLWVGRDGNRLLKWEGIGWQRNLKESVKHRQGNHIMSWLVLDHMIYHNIESGVCHVVSLSISHDHVAWLLHCSVDYRKAIPHG